MVVGGATGSQPVGGLRVRRSTAREFSVFAFYLVLAIALTWPLARHVDTAVSDLGDPLLNTWILDWDCYALTHAPLRLYQAPIFYPSKYPLAYSENLVGIAILCLPFYLAGLPPMAIYNIAVILGFAFSAYGGFVLGRVITRNFAAALIAGILYGFVPYKLAHLAHLQILWSGWLPLLLAALLAYRISATLRNAFLVGATFLMNGLTNIYFLLFASVAVGLTLVLVAIAESRDRRFWLRLAGALVVACLLLLPFLIPYRVVADEYGMKRGAGETLGGSAVITDWLIGPTRSALYGPLIKESWRFNERQLFPGAMMLLLSLLAARRRPDGRSAAGPAAGVPAGQRPALRWLDATIAILAVVTTIGAFTSGIHIAWHGRVLLDFTRSYLPAMALVVCVVARLAHRLRWAMARSRFPLELWVAALWIAVGIVGSLGMHTFFHVFLFHRVMPFRSIRVPARWAMIGYVGMTAWAATGIAALKRRWLIPILLVLALIDVWPRIRWEHALVDPSPSDRWIATMYAGPLAELPIHRLDVLYFYLLRATAHHVPIFDGISGFEPPLHRALRERPLDDGTLDLLERNGCRFVLVRPDWFESRALIASWLRSGMAQGRLALLRRFDAGINGDWLFALSRVEREWRRFRAPDVRDAAGLTLDEELARLLDGKPTYNGSTFGQLAEPEHGAEIAGPMAISGWALSPHGIRSVNVLVDGGRFRTVAALYDRPELLRLFPWYPRTPRPAFAMILPRRPKGIPQETDVQIEIVDGGGAVTKLSDVPVTWR